MPDIARSRRYLNFVVTIMLLALVSGCAGTSTRPVAPKISVSSLEPVELGFDQQTFRFTLNAFNPNGYDLPVEGVEFVIRISGIEIARGFSENRVTIPASDTVLLDVDVTTDLAKVVGDIKSLFTSSALTLNYEMEGNLRLADNSSGIAFNLSGVLLGED